MIRPIPCVAAAVLAFSACAPRSTLKGGSSSSQASASGSAKGARAPGETEAGLPSNTEAQEASLRGKEFAAASDLQVVHFEYDKYELSADARQALQANSTYLKAHADQEVLVEGHCDERGTIEYNLALGQKRAKEVRDYYLRLGVAGKSVATLSYGKERLPCHESTEQCWAASRRAETKIRARTASTRIRK